MDAIRGGTMNFKLAAVALLFASVSASAAQAIQWTGAGWYVLAYGPVSDELTGWLELSAGPYPDAAACKSEEDRQNQAETEYMVLHMCRNVQKPPKPTLAGGIAIWQERQ